MELIINIKLIFLNNRYFKNIDVLPFNLNVL